MKIAYISTYMPRPCGLATFNSNLKNAIDRNLLKSTDESFVIAINDQDDLAQYPYGKEISSLSKFHAFASLISLINSLTRISSSPPFSMSCSY
ncbi:MAG TPA: hypothetical protein VL125_16245 [Pelobium sp.]|nr:hypothetical protein [Pelobium sp.]